MKRELTNQELLDRYIHSVKMGLPLDKMEDIAAEIRSNLQSLVEDRAMQLGRELNLEEVSAILKQHGHPIHVAGRYRERPGRGRGRLKVLLEGQQYDLLSLLDASARDHIARCTLPRLLVPFDEGELCCFSLLD